MVPALPPYDFSQPHLLPLFLLLPLFWLWQWRTFRRLPTLVSLLLHSVVLALLILAVAGLHTLRPGTASIPLLFLDLSQSLTAPQRQWMQETIEQQLRPEAETPTIVFAGSAQQVSWREAKAMLAQPPDELTPNATNLKQALTLLLDETPNRHVYLFTDGWEVSEHDSPTTEKSDENELGVRALFPLLKERQLKMYPFLPPPPATVPNIAIQRFGVPQAANGGETVQARIALENTNPRPVRGELKVTENGRVVWQQPLTLTPGASVFTHPIAFPETDNGLIPLRAVFTPSAAPEDTIQPDNQATAWISLTAREKEILLLSARAQDNRYLARVLTTRGLGTTAVDLPATIPPLSSFRSVILNNVARNKLPASVASELDNYVRQGGGLVMIGGEESLGLGGYKGSEIEQVLPVTVTPPQKEEHTTAVVLVVDTSGSMRRESKLLYAKEGIRAVARNLKDRDFFGVIGFDTEPFPVIPVQRMGSVRGDIDSRLERLVPSGGTFLLPALEEAKRQLERQPATRKHMIVLTDGETGGSGSEYLDLVSVMNRELKITISSIAVGEEPNLRLLSRIADYGGGAFHHTTTPENLPDLFVGEMRQEKKPEEKTMVEKDLAPIANPGSPILQSLENRTFPTIKGYVATEAKPGARTDISLPANGKRPPLLASWSYGRGKSVAFTSDANGRWSAPWVSWDGFGKFWEQAVRWTLGENSKSSDKAENQTRPHFSVELGHNNDGLVIDVFSYGPSEEGKAAFARITGPSSADASLSLQRLAPGHYQGVYQTTKSGDYRVDVTLPNGENLGPLGYTLPRQNNIAEVPQPQPNTLLLEALVTATGGAVNPDPTSLVLPVAAPEPHSLLPYLIPLAMAVYFLELLIRRLV